MGLKGQVTFRENIISEEELLTQIPSWAAPFDYTGVVLLLVFHFSGIVHGTNTLNENALLVEKLISEHKGGSHIV